MKLHSILPAAVLAHVVLSALPAYGAASYHLLKKIPVAGDEGWDYLSVDASHHRVYVSRGTHVVVIDTTRDEIVGDIANTPGVHGIAIASDLGRAFSSNGRESKASIVDLATLRTISQVSTGENPDAILYEPTLKEVYAFNGHGRSATVFTAATGAVVGTIPLDGKPEFAVVDAQSGRIYDNLEDKNEVAVIDAKTHAVSARWSSAPGEEPAGLAIDPAHRRLFLGCGNARIIVLNAANGKRIASLPAGEGIDATDFDPGTQLVFASNGRDGTVSIFHEDSPDSYSPVQTLVTQKGARTMIVDPTSHKIYLSAAQFAPPAPATDGRRVRPQMVPGSFTVLVFGMGG